MPDLLRIASVLAALSALAGCVTVEPASRTHPLDGTAWVLAALAGAVDPGARIPTLAFVDGHATGTDGCNRYRLPYRAEDDTLAVGPHGPSTRMACPPAIAQRADVYQRALGSTRSWRMRGEYLELLDDQGVRLAAFVPQPRDLPGTSWRVTAYANGRGGVVSVLAGTRLTLAFASAGRAGGFGGCNRYSAGYAIDGAEIRIAAPAATRMACMRPEGVMAQERAYFVALASAATARFEADRLELRDARGALAVALVRADGSP